MTIPSIPLPTPSPDPSQPGDGLAEIRSILFPWSDLNAKSPPQRYLNLGHDILPTLGVLIGMAPDGPHLIQTDGAGVTKVTEPIPTLPGSINQGNAQGQGPFTLHINSGVLVTPAAPYLVWRISQATLRNNANLLIYGWSLSFDTISDAGAGSQCFASLTGTGQLIFSGPTTNSTEIWNKRLSNAGVLETRLASEVSFAPRPLVVVSSSVGPAFTPVDSNLQFEAPVANTSYQVRGVMTVEVVPVH